jgi:hypothetical protein
MTELQWLGIPFLEDVTSRGRVGLPQIAWREASAQQPDAQALPVGFGGIEVQPLVRDALDRFDLSQADRNRVDHGSWRTIGLRKAVPGGFSWRTDHVRVGGCQETSRENDEGVHGEDGVHGHHPTRRVTPSQETRVADGRASRRLQGGRMMGAE